MHRIPTLSFLAIVLGLSLLGCRGKRPEATGAVRIVTASVQPTAAQTTTSQAALPSLTTAASATSPPEQVQGAQPPTMNVPGATSSPFPTVAGPTPHPEPTHSATPETIAPLDTPPSWEASPIPETAEPTSPPDQGVTDLTTIQVGLREIVGGLDSPVGIAHADDKSQRLFIVEKKGRIRFIQDGALADTVLLDITERVGSSASEQGLLGLAFHPNFAQNGFLFVNYTDRQGNSIIARFSADADRAQADPASEVVLLTLQQPAGNHNGGHLAFGPDGFLYIGMGDGGAAADRFGNGQNPQTLLGAMLRLDVDREQPYAIPVGNPFVGDPAARDEIWAIGLRNPWRFSFDRLTGDLYIADVGQNRFEEINLQPAKSNGGQNYGWPIMEASHCHPEGSSCDTAGLTLPQAEYDHSVGCSVTGGYVYRGQQFPELRGIYLFGDYCSGRLWGLVPDEKGARTVVELAQVDLRLSSFGEDEGGELYLLDMQGGRLYQIVARDQ